MYYTGIDPFTGHEIQIARQLKDRKAQRALLQFFKPENYFEVRHVDFSVSPATATKVPISDKCSIEVKDLGNSNLEVVLIGKGKEVARVKQVLRKGEILVPAGDAPNETAWLAILRRVQ